MCLIYVIYTSNYLGLLILKIKSLCGKPFLIWTINRREATRGAN